MNETSKTLAFITVTIRSIIIIVGFFSSLFLTIRGVNGADTLSWILFFGLLLLVLEWTAVIKSGESTGWAITLLILGILLLINFSILNLICAIVYVAYSIKCIQDD